MAAAWTTVPHVTQFDEADLGNLEHWLEPYQAKAEKAGTKITLTALLTKLVALGLRSFPRFNASYDAENQELILKKYCHIGIAVDTEKGLLVPVVRDADQKSILTLAREIGELAQQARDQKLKPDQLQGGCFTISNLGGIGGTNFTPVVYHPQVAILGIARSRKQPVWQGEKFEPRDILPLSLSYDHRVIDGAEGAKFLQWITAALADPVKMIMEGGS